MMDKDALRKAIKARRRALPAEEQAQAAQDVSARLSGFAPFREAGVVMAYIAARGELSLAPVIEEMLAAGKTVALPLCEAPGVMTARRIERIEDLRPGAFGLLEPGKACGVVPPDAIDLVLVPGVAFDRRGGRIGQGGGYYDRFLPATRALRVGVCHDFALIDEAPVCAHDVRMQWILTPQELIFCDETTSDDRRA